MTDGEQGSSYTTPDWFWEAIDIKPQQDSVVVADANINYLAWSESGKPGLLLVHGHNAHAHWWDFIAPSFRENFQVVALDLSGMGDSDHRDGYSADTYADEIAAVADACKMPDDTLLVSHSYGGVMSIRAMARHANRFGGLILLDSGVKHPDDERPPEPERGGSAKVYPSAEVAAARFRLQPPQQCENQYIVDHIARNSVEFIPEEDGFSWKFDEEQRSRMLPYDNLAEDFAAITKPCALIYGALSESFSSNSADYMKSLLPQLEVTELPDAQHHLFLDQPLTFMETLIAQLKRWS